MDLKNYTVDAARKQELKDIITKELASRSDIGFACLFGSFIDGSPAFRDIDLGVYYRQTDRRKNFNNAIDLSVKLTLKTTIPVDARPLNDAPATFLYKVLKGELICEHDEDLRCRVTENTLRDYFDIKPILYRAMKEAFAS